MVAYASGDDLKTRLSGDTILYDGQLDSAVEAASRWIETYCDRIFTKDAADVVRTFAPCHQYRFDLPDFNDVVSITTLETDTSGDGTFETTWSTSDYQLLPYNRNAAPEELPVTAIQAIGGKTFPIPWGVNTRRDRIRITGIFGWPAVPDNVAESCLILAAELFRLKDAPFGIAAFGESGVMRIRGNPHVAMLLDPYRRNPVLVA